MFNFKNVAKLFSYKWGEVIKKLLPKGNNTTMDETECKNIRNGSILRIIGVVFSKVAIVGTAIQIVVKTYKWLYGSSILNYAIDVALKENLGKWIIETIIAAIIPIAILVYTMIMKNKKQNGWPIFIILIISTLHTLYYVYRVVIWFTYITISPIFAIVGILSVLFAFLGNVHIVVGCIDFLVKQYDEYIGVANANQSGAPMNAQGTDQNVQSVAPAPVGPSVQPVAPAPVDPSVQPVAPAPVGPSVQPVAPAPVGPSIPPVAPAPIGPSVQPVAPAPVGPSVQPVAPAPVGPSVQPVAPASAGPRTCPNCGAPADGNEFCGFCGTKI